MKKNLTFIKNNHVNRYICKTFQSLTFILIILSAITFTGIIVVSSKIPDSVSIIEDQNLSFDTNFPISYQSKSKKFIQATKTKVGKCHYQDQIKLFGCVPVKNICVDVVKETYVEPGGETFGVKLYTDGVLIVGMTDVDSANGGINPASDAGVEVGDVIIAIDSKPVFTNSEVGKIFSESEGEPITLSLKRNNVAFSTTVKAVKSTSTGEFKAGLWVRDSTAGIGTITFYNDKSHTFGGLGHGICDVDTGNIMPLMTADVVKADIHGIQKGVKGKPGELVGNLEDLNWGKLLCNAETGVIGELNSYEVKEEIPVAMSQEIKKGPAEIISCIDGLGPKRYSVEIQSINYNDNLPTKNMVIKVTDKELLSKTGGIVQGMSGSPIIQNGKLVGALTHVFVNEPDRGYGIFAQNMINTAKVLDKSY